jgi:DNA repair protein RadC
MGTTIYDRPREKLYARGAAVLTNMELLQVIIGSGSAGIPVTKIARRADKLLRLKGAMVTFAELIALQGMGRVKTGQLLAGFELARRLEHLNDGFTKTTDVLADLYNDLNGLKAKNLLYMFFDGSGRLLYDDTQLLDTSIAGAKVARKLFAEALAQSTASICVAIGGGNQSYEPDMYELSLARYVYRTAELLSIPVKSFLLVTSDGQFSIKNDLK